LTGVAISANDLTGWNFANQNLTNSDFSGAILSEAQFANAEVRGARFYKTWGSEVGTGITLSQIYSTASYLADDLTGIGLSHHDLNGANFAGQNLSDAAFVGSNLSDSDFHDAKLTNAYFGGATLTGSNFRAANLANANFFGLIAGTPAINPPVSTNFPAMLIEANLTAADARGALGLDVSNATTTNLIRPDGHISSLNLSAGSLLVVRDHDGNPKNEYGSPISPVPIPITVDEHLAMSSGGTLRTVFEADAWDSTISFAPDIPVTLGGTLELTFASDVNPASQIGRTFDLFDWSGVNPTGEFAVTSSYAWDLSNLYTTGEVTLTAIPEPGALLLLSFALTGIVATFRVRHFFIFGNGALQ
jgi:uncharacterized protein YjbI with pentapeptide repeats